MNAAENRMISAASVARLIAHLQLEDESLRYASDVFREVGRSPWTSTARGRLGELLANLEVRARHTAEKRRQLVANLSSELGWNAADVTLSGLHARCPVQQRADLREAAGRLRLAARQIQQLAARIGYMALEWQGLYESILHALCGSTESDRYGATGRLCLPQAMATQDVRS